MARHYFLIAAVVLCQTAAVLSAADTAPKIDKAKVETYVRYAEGFSPEVKMTIDDPTASPYKGLWQVLTHLSFGEQKLDRVYYVSPDGQRLIRGDVWDLKENPFRANLERLPTDGPSFGPENAKVTIIVFSDFECPFCREFAKTVRDNVPQKYPTDVRVIFKDFPIASVHQWAQAAAEASHCIAAQKPAAFWAFHDYIYDHQQEIDPASLKNRVLDVAKQQNLDGLQVSSCMDSHSMADVVDKSHELGLRLQIDRTPTIFVNGRMIPAALKWESLDSVIKLELNRPKEFAGKSDEKCCEVTMPTIGRN